MTGFDHFTQRASTMVRRAAIVIFVCGVLVASLIAGLLISIVRTP